MANLKESSWIALCREYARTTGTSENCITLLHAFVGPNPQTWNATSFEELEVQSDATLQQLPAQIIETLDGEIDRPQAEMFSRRFASVVQLLKKQAATHPEARVLKVGLILRMQEILDAAGPRALRVRAVADFYYSQSAIIHHRPDDTQLPQSYKALIQAFPWDEIGQGIAWKQVTGLTASGPIHVNILKLENPRLRTVDCRLFGENLSIEALAKRENALAAVSGGFFLYSEPDIEPPSRRTDPVGFLMDAGKVLNPPVLRRATVFQAASGSVGMKRIGPKGLGFTWNCGPNVRIESHNDNAAPSQHIQSYNRAFGKKAPASPGTNLVIVGNLVQSVTPEEVDIPLAGVVIALPGSEAPSAGSHIQWLAHPQHEADPIVEAMAGGPMLLQEGQPCIDRSIEDFAKSAPPVTFSQDETFDQNLLPRMAAGIDEDGYLYFAAIDGRNFHKAPGMTLQQTGEWMQALGCVRAMNLDGGSSKRMVVQGSVVDLPSTEVVGDKAGEESVRPVHSAILIYPGRSG